MNIISVIIGLFGLGILAAVHEIGHFLVANWLGIKVEELSIFVGPSLFHWKRKGVEYNIRLIPFGAYVRFPGILEDDNGISNPYSYINQPRWKRLLVSLAGPLTNVIFGILIFVITFSIFGFYTPKLDTFSEGTQIVKTSAVPGDRIEYLNGNRIFTDLDLNFFLSKVMNDKDIDLTLVSSETGEPYSVTLVPEIYDRTFIGITVLTKEDEQEGWEIIAVEPSQNNNNPLLKVGDYIVSVNDAPFFEEEYDKIMKENGNKEIKITFIRDGVKQDVNLVPAIRKVSNYRGIYSSRGSGFGDLLRESLLYPVSIIRVSVLALQDLFSGRVEVQNVLSGPVGMVMMVNQVVETPDVDNSLKVEQLLQMAGLISVGLAFSNMLPLPGLDGNALVLVTVEMIRGKKISVMTRESNQRDRLCCFDSFSHSCFYVRCYSN